MGTINKLLSIGDKNDDLYNVWIAGHFPKHIHRKLVEKTNIGTSVDKILVDKYPVVTYRVLGAYLLGVTKIYSKKVEYLLVDCNHSLHEMKFFSKMRKKVDVNYSGMCLPESSSRRSQLQIVDANSSESSRRKSNYAFVETMRAQFSSVSLPDCFDLDAYDLEFVLDDSNNHHVKPHMELVLNDAWENHGRLRHAFGKDDASASTSAMITNVHPETSIEKFKHRFALEECLEPMVLSDSDEELVPDSVHLIEQAPEFSNCTESSDTVFEGAKSPDKYLDEECITTGQTVVSEMASVDNITLKPSPNKSHLSVAIDVTPQSTAPVVSGQRKRKRKSEFVATHTPASRENARAPRKHKCVYDYAVIVPKEVYVTWLSDASDLMRQRRGCVEVLERKEERRSFDFLMQPKISIFSQFPSDISLAISANDLVVVEEVEETVGPTIVEEVEEMVGPTISKNNEIGPLNVHNLSVETEAEVIAPLTPATQSTSLRFNDTHETSMVKQMGPTSSCESREKAMSTIRDVGLDETQTVEGPSSLGEDNQENVLVAEKLSAATKTVASYLHSNFVQRQEKGEEEAVNLSQILKQKTKKESAVFFYQMLVLKTGGYIDVKQEKPYNEICVKQTPKLKEAFSRE